MQKDAHAFFRGTCHLFYEDWPKTLTLNEAPLVWVCGDLHIENFGAYRGDNDLLYFDIADFDEAALAPCTWDLTRLLTSVLVAAKVHGAKRNVSLALCESLLDAYCLALRDGKARWIERAIARGIIRNTIRRVEGTTPRAFLDKRTVRSAGKTLLRIDGEHTLQVSTFDRKRVRRVMREVGEASRDPSFYRVLDVARRIAGTGSLGLERYSILIQGSSRPPRRHRLLDLKVASPSALAPHLKTTQTGWNNDAERIATIQRRVQAIAPALLRSVAIEDRAYVLRELMPTQDKVALRTSRSTLAEFEHLAKDVGCVVGWDELRSSGRGGSATADDLARFAERRKWRKVVLNYAEDYVAVVFRDWKAFREAYRDRALA